MTQTPPTHTPALPRTPVPVPRPLATGGPSVSGSSSWVRLAIFGAILLAHAPLLFVHFQQLWSRPHYQFFPMVLLAFLFLVWTQLSDHHGRPAGRRSLLWGRLLLCASCGLLALGVARISPNIATISFVLAVAGMFLELGIPAWGPWCLLWLLIRIPYGQDLALIQWMQQATTRLSSTALEALKIQHLLNGNVLEFPTQKLFVEEACSGVVSLMAVVACAAILAVWARRSLLHGLLLCLSGIFWAGAMNVVRVVAIAVALDQFQVNLLEGWRHDALGLVIFAVNLIALYSTDRLLLFLLSGIRMNPMASYWPYVEDNPFVHAWNCVGDPPPPAGLDGDDDEVLRGYAPSSAAAPQSQRPTPTLVPEMGLAVAFVALGAVQAVAGIGPFAPQPTISAAALSLSAESVPQSLAGWELVDFETQERDSFSAFGEHSRIWTFQKRLDERTVLTRLSLDFAFPEWHGLTACYQGIGWTIDSSRRHESDEVGPPIVEAALSKPNREYALLLFDLFDAEGRPYEAPTGILLHPKLRRLLDGDSTPWSLPTYYQAQALSAQLDTPVSEGIREEIRLLFVAFRRQMSDLVANSQQPRQ